MPKLMTDADATVLDWIVRVGDPAFDDWEAFQAWLEADPGHALRYHALSAEVDDMVTASAAAPAAIAPRIAVPIQPARARRPRRPLWIGGALAASLALTVGYVTLRETHEPYVVETAPGALRTVALADGSRITLAGATRVVLDRRDARIAALDHGQALFQVRHDASDPFEVTVGGQKLVDIGTVFEVKRRLTETRIAVSEGAVDFGAHDGIVRLVAGQGLVARDGAAAVSGRVDPASVGAWRRGTLAYDGVPVSEVAADLSRSLGISVTADLSVAARPFYGTIVIAEIKRDPSRMAAVLDLTARRNGTAWALTAKP
ncbi:FecR family protein [Sphingomonas sp. PB4P5]|uniref:FecR family protein n=1 Tax=Parasphingomonas puruogangriensis TaxID=3096155 RepID=UPI002FC6C4FC